MAHSEEEVRGGWWHGYEAMARRSEKIHSAPRQHYLKFICNISNPLPSMSSVCARTMADNAFEWARRNGRLFKSEIHGEEEADIPLEWTWTTSNESGQKTAFASAFSMDVPSRILVDHCLLISCAFSVPRTLLRIRTVPSSTGPTRTWAKACKPVRARRRVTPWPQHKLGLLLRFLESKPPEALNCRPSTTNPAQDVLPQLAAERFTAWASILVHMCARQED